MEQVLSQEEIDALLHGISDGEIETRKVEAPEEHIEAKSFDYIRYTRGKKERLPALEFIYDRCSKSFSGALAFMRKS